MKKMTNMCKNCKGYGEVWDGEMSRCNDCKGTGLKKKQTWGAGEKGTFESTQRKKYVHTLKYFTNKGKSLVPCDVKPTQPKKIKKIEIRTQKTKYMGKLLSVSLLEVINKLNEIIEKLNQSRKDKK